MTRHGQSVGEGGAVSGLGADAQNAGERGQPVGHPLQAGAIFCFFSWRGVLSMATGRPPWSAAPCSSSAGMHPGPARRASLWALFASLCYAVYAVTASYLITNGAGDRAVVGAIFGGAAVLLMPALFTSPMSWVATGPGLAVATYLAVLTTALAYLIYARGLRTTAVTTVTTLGLAEPAVAAVLGLAVLGEHLTITGLAGLGVLAVGLVIAAWPARRPTAAATSDRALGQPQKGATPSGVTSTPSSG
jgi:drug/metabolite transporter (DMT)-like permease